MVRSIYLLLVALIICGCQGNYSAEWNNVVENNIDEIIIEEVTTDVLPLSKEMIHAKDIFVYNDSILVVLNNPTADYYIQVYIYLRLLNEPDTITSLLVRCLSLSD